ncbi:MAG TPA: hypothetical protein VLV48_07825 [Thermoanaerobaculia bacterium]|nr:hypothetical protein [Thermoanaerobaculia bacterium]
MKVNHKLALALVAVLALGGFSACKHSGVGVSSGGQIVGIDIDAPETLADSSETQELKISIRNSGVSRLGGFGFDVEMPNELVVLSQTQSPGVTWTERVTSGGTKLYHYEVNEISVGSRAEVRYHVRTAFGSLDRTGDIKVTAHSDQLPEGSLVETKFIRLSR